MARFLRHGIVDSTNERAFAALSTGEALDGDVHIARGQEAGRGRLGRAWESEPGSGLYLSWVHLPAPPGPSPPALTMAAGLAVWRTLRSLGLTSGEAGLRLKWPNDVLFDHAKLAGILIESRGLQPTSPHFVIGIGVNVLQRTFPAELLAERAVTSLALLGCDVTPDSLAPLLAAELGTQLVRAGSAPGEIASAYLDATGLSGRAVEVSLGDHAVGGVLTGIDFSPAGGGLLLETDTGLCRIQLAHVHGVTPVLL